MSDRKHDRGPRSEFKSIVKNNFRWAAALAKWASNVVHKDSAHNKNVWNDKLATEIAFWDRYLATEGLSWPEEFRRRTDAEAEMEPPIARFVESENCKILDVGAGPLTVVGTRWKGHKMDVTAVDPLADAYTGLLEKYKIVPPVRTQKVAAEELSLYFGQNTFDLSFARNCLDHSYDPFLAIQQMLSVTKQGGTIVLLHEINEGSNELYRGLHQWNFTVDNSDLRISAPGRDSIHVAGKLGASVDVSVTRDEGWVTAVIRKN